MNPFRGPAVAVLCAVTGVSLLAALLWWVFGRELLPSRSAGPDTFSRSAVGHRALLELLREIGVPTVVSRFNSGGRARESALLVIAEPEVRTAEQERMLARMIKEANRVLLVLPKWSGTVSDENPAFLEAADLLAPEEVADLLDVADVGAEVVRLDEPPASWQASELGVSPSLDRPQLIRGPGLQPIVKCREGNLFALASSGRRRLYVLSDPDLISTHGLARAGNAAAAIEILDFARGGGRDAIVFDETLHGFGKEPSLYRSLFEMPLGLATMQALLAAAALLWAAMGRFGAPHPVPPPFEAGKETLVANIASLLALGGHGGHALKRYYEGAVAEVRAALHVPPMLKAAEAEERLDAMRRTTRLRELRELVDEEGRGDRRHVLSVALRIHRWREDMIRARAGKA